MKCRRDKHNCQKGMAAAAIENATGSAVFPGKKRYFPRQRRTGGQILPLAAFGLVALVAALGIAIDLMRNFQTVEELQYAAQASGLYAMSLATAADGSYSQDIARANMSEAVMSAGNGQWNTAQSGPFDTGSPWQSAVAFSADDITFVGNPNRQDVDDLFLQVRARRDGDDALTRLFIPAVYAARVFAGGTVPDEARTASPYRIAEIVGQPAARIGAAVPDGASGLRAGELANFACLPLAISNEQFVSFAQSNQAASSIEVDLVDSQSAEYNGAAPQGHVKGCFVNVAATGDANQYYGSAEGDLAIDELESLLGYFTPGASPRLSPGVVERGSLLSGFDPAHPAFKTRAAELAARAAALPYKYYIVPVVRNDPSFTQHNEVVGFARLKLTGASTKSGALTSLTCEIGESVPVRNASCGSTLVSVPQASGQQLPAPVAPFLPRTVDQPSGGLTARPRGVVLAPALSPRSFGAG